MQVQMTRLDFELVESALQRLFHLQELYLECKVCILFPYA